MFLQKIPPIAKEAPASIRALLIVLIPYLSQYKMGSSGLDVGTILMVALFLEALTRSRKGEWSWLLLSVYCVVTTGIAICLGWMTEISLRTSIVRMGKMLVAFYYISLSKDDIDAYSLKKSYYCMGDLATYAIFLQVALYMAFNIDLKFNHGIQLLPPVTGRPCSIFEEPSQYSSFMFVLLAMTFFSNEQDVYYKGRKILYSLGILFSTSGQGYVILAVIWMLYILHRGFVQRKKDALVGMVLLFLAFLIALRIPIIYKAFSRIFTNPMVILGRLTGFGYIKDFTAGQLLIGTGFGNRVTGYFPNGGAIYYNGISAIISGSGLIGLALYALICLDYLKKSTLAYRVAILLIWALMFSANLFYAPYMVLFFSIIKKSLIQASAAPETETSSPEMISLQESKKSFFHQIAAHWQGF